MNSLQRLLQLGLTLSLLLLMGVLWWAGSFAVRGVGENLITSRLEHDAESLLAAMTFTEADQLPQLKYINPIYKRPFSGHYYIVRMADGSIQNSRSLWNQTLDLQMNQPNQAAQWYAPGPSGQKLLVWAKQYTKQGHRLTLLVAEDLTPLEEHLSLFQWTFAGISLAVLFILLIVQQQVIRWSFKRLDALRSEIRSLEQGEISTLSQDVPDEILPLVLEFNRLLELLTQRLGRSRNSLGNLTHALKGPLNLLMQYLDSKELNNHPELRAQMQEQQKRIQTLMERELKRARLAGVGTPGYRFSAQQELPDLIKVLKQVHHKHPVDIQLHITADTPAFGDREDMLELMGNILDNACKWANSRVVCNIALTAADSITITIEDDGPGCSEAEVNQLTQRGIRLDETTEGHGLGLAIAKDIVKLYSGKMEFNQSEALGGLSITIVLAV